MWKKFVEALALPRKPASKVEVISLLRWLMAWIGSSFVLAFLDMIGVIYVRANKLLVFLFLGLGLIAYLYLEVSAAGLGGNKTDPETTRID